MHPFVRQDPPAEYTIEEWRYENVSVVVMQAIGHLRVQAWVHREKSYPEVMVPTWATESAEDVLKVVEELARVLAPLVLSSPLMAPGERALRYLAMKEYGDVYDDSIVKLYNRTDPPGENPWLDELAELEEAQRTGIRRHTFNLNLDAPHLGHVLAGRGKDEP